jgi:parallel beta-helix repeat protein
LLSLGIAAAVVLLALAISPQGVASGEEHEPLIIEAEDAQLTGGMQVNQAPDASGGEFIQLSGQARLTVDGEVAFSDATFCFVTPEGGHYSFSARIQSGNSSSSYLLRIDFHEPWIWQVPRSKSFQDIEVLHPNRTGDVRLEAGQHVISFAPRRSSSRMDLLIVTPEQESKSAESCEGQSRTSAPVSTTTTPGGGSDESTTTSTTGAPHSTIDTTTSDPAPTTTAPATTSTTKPTTTTSVAESTTTTTSGAPAGAIPVTPGTNIQAAVEAYPAGTAFFLEAGIHMGQSIEPKAGNSFIGAPGAVLDGGNVTVYAFENTADNVRIEGLEIRNYNNPPQMGAIKAGGHSPGESTSGWQIIDNDIHHNAGAGVRIGSMMLLSGNHIHHNRQLGVGGIGTSTVIANNDISYNNYLNDYDAGWEAGGTKFVKTNGLVVRNNVVHHNNGPGLWTDIENSNTLYENNHVYDNRDTGIFHEISYSAVIRGNRVERNGSEKWGAAGILVAASSNVEIYGNTVVDNGNAIVATQQNRGGYTLDHLNVHDNTVRYTNNKQGWVGVLQDVGDTGVFSRNIRFEGNTYEFVDGKLNRFAWMNATRSWAEWQSYGNDLTGRLN